MIEKEKAPKTNNLLADIRLSADSSLEDSFLDEYKTIAQQPPARSLNVIEDAILNNLKLENAQLMGTNRMVSEFIAISRHSKSEDWIKLIESVSPPNDYDDIYTKPLYKSDTHELILVWAKDIIPDEVHTDVSESFFILEGTVDCYIGDDVFSMVVGDFMQIPMDTHHKVVVTSSTPGKAIMSRIAV